MLRVIALSALLFSGLAAQARDDTYTAGIEKWRRDFDADVRTGGWLTLVGRVRLDGEMWTLGSDPKSSIPLPSRAPAHLAVLRKQGQAFRFEPAPGADAVIDGKPVRDAVNLSTESGTGSIVAAGLTLSVRLVGGDPYLFVVDPQTAAVSAFKGTSWYEVDPAYRVEVKFEPYAQERNEPVPMTHVDSKQSFPSTGDVILKLKGKRARLKTYIDDGQLFVMFLDETNGRGSYGGGRFVHAPLPKNGRTILDFNKAFNPYCSVNPNVMCPIPPPENRLAVEVSAGEKFLDQE
jgi:uncharacterized protein (DUF1684 family)